MGYRVIIIIIDVRNDYKNMKSCCNYDALCSIIVSCNETCVYCRVVFEELIRVMRGAKPRVLLSSCLNSYYNNL